jgi:mannose-6-phosphate isomerase class I
MTMAQDRVDRLLDPLLARLEREARQDKDSPDYWALAASRAFPLAGGHRDRGIFSIYLLNLLHLRPGQGTFQPAGTLHAYLEGVNVELMASSDNVLRGGLTPKHVDVRELLRTLSFDSGRPPILEGRLASETERVYEAPVEDFVLSKIEVAHGRVFEAGAAHGPDCLLVCDGSARAQWPSGAMEMPRGVAVFAPAGLPYSLEPGAEGASAVIFRAGVPPLTKS